LRRADQCKDDKRDPGNLDQRRLRDVFTVGMLVRLRTCRAQAGAYGLPELLGI
jgi:hypothetical protein